MAITKSNVSRQIEASYDGVRYAAYPAGDKPVPGGEETTPPGGGGSDGISLFRTATFDLLTTGSNGISATDGYDTKPANSATSVNTVRADRYYSGGKSLECFVPQGISGGGRGWGVTFEIPSANLQTGDELWTRFRVYWPSTFRSDTSDGTMKLIRHRAFNSGGGLVKANDVNVWDTGSGPIGFALFAPNDNNRLNVPFTWPARNNWITFEMYSKFAASGVMRAWCNGQYIGERTGNMELTGVVRTQLEIFNFFNLTVPQDQSLWLDQVDIATSRVESPTNTDAGGRPYLGI